MINNFPAFMWLLRDFSLRLQDERGEAISAKQYLENALKPQKGLSEQVDQRNRIRRHVSEFFRQKDCFTLIRPARGEDELQNLGTLPLSALRPEFVQ
jgi:hypothetical protein